jgi:hypothetical protein
MMLFDRELEVSIRCVCPLSTHRRLKLACITSLGCEVMQHCTFHSKRNRHSSWNAPMQCTIVRRRQLRPIFFMCLAHMSCRVEESRVPEGHQASQLVSAVCQAPGDSDALPSHLIQCLPVLLGLLHGLGSPRTWFCGPVAPLSWCKTGGQDPLRRGHRQRTRRM